MSGTPGAVNLIAGCDSELIAPRRAISSATGRNIGRNLFLGDESRTRATKSLIAESHCSLGWIQLVFIFASLSAFAMRSEEHTSELQSRLHLVCRLLLEKK